MFDSSEFKGWPSGDLKPVLEIILQLSEIEARYGLVFRREKDDLDWYMGTHINDPEIGPIVLMRHDGSPDKGVITYVDSGVHTSDAIERIIRILEIENEDIGWRALVD